MSFFHVGSSAHPKIMKNHYISSKNHEISSKNHEFWSKIRYPKMRNIDVYLPQKRVRKRATKVRSEWFENHRFWVTFWTNYHGCVDFFSIEFWLKRHEKSSKISEKSWNFIEKSLKSLILIENSVPQNARYLCIFTAKASAKASEINFRWLVACCCCCC